MDWERNRTPQRCVRQRQPFRPWPLRPVYTFTGIRSSGLFPKLLLIGHLGTSLLKRWAQLFRVLSLKPYVVPVGPTTSIQLLAPAPFDVVRHSLRSHPQIECLRILMRLFVPDQPYLSERASSWPRLWPLPVWHLLCLPCAPPWYVLVCMAETLHTGLQGWQEALDYGFRIGP